MMPGSKDVKRILRILFAFLVPLFMFSACMDDDFEGDLRDVCPKVEDYSPGDQENALINSIITARFNKDMKPESINHNTFLVSGPDGRISGSLSYDNRHVTFVPDSYLPELSDITVTITTEVYDWYDFTIEKPEVWTFTTGTIDEITAPYVIYTIPDRDAQNVPVFTFVSATFNEPLDQASVTQNSLRLFNDQGQQVPGNVTYADNTIMLTLDDDLEYETVYEAVVAAGITDLAGNVMEQDYTWVFTTESIDDVFPLPVNISAISNYAILSGLYIWNTEGTSMITGDIGLYPGVLSDIVGIDLDAHVDGNYYAEGDTLIPALQMKLIIDKMILARAYNDAKDADNPVPQLISGDQGGITLKPGIYSAKKLRILNGDLILDAGGDPDAFWVFQVESLLETGGAGGNIILAGNANPDHIFWQVGVGDILGPNTLIGADTEFVGTILSKQGISVGYNANVTGRLMVKEGGVRMKNATISLP